MVKCKGPVFSLDARGTLADSLTFSNYKGQSVAKRKPKFTASNSTGQNLRRIWFRYLSRVWNLLSDSDKNLWIPLAETWNISPLNAFYKRNLLLLSSEKFPIETPDAVAETPFELLVDCDAWWHENGFRIMIYTGVLEYCSGWALCWNPTNSPAWIPQNCLLCAPFTGTERFYDFLPPLMTSPQYFTLVGWDQAGIMQLYPSIGTLDNSHTFFSSWLSYTP